MAYRKRMRKSKDRAVFTKTAIRTDRKNVANSSFRGGIRL